jgi:hypothetical protein
MKHGIKNRILIFVSVFLIISALVSSLFPLGVFASTKYESYTTGNNFDQLNASATWLAQTFTPTVKHTITSVKLLIYRFNYPGTISVGIEGTSSGNPSGVDLCSGITDGNTLPTSSPYEWRVITLGAGAVLLPNTKYAIVIHGVSADGSNCLRWRMNTTNSPPYNGGSYDYSSDSGVHWYPTITFNFEFEEWGEPYIAPPSITTGATTNITSNISS